ncbi:MAG: hypothetical protein HC929_04725 [Leptolyngbyaceae cyanobacterium SM2_5_2]|nr:hypothetical protein [Leptolyngbyaceae cyanobacterium SM2_5_2]
MERTAEYETQGQQRYRRFILATNVLDTALMLLVYSLGQRQLRAQLAQADDTMLDQKQRPTSKPTFRWILQKFQAIYLVSMGSAQQVSNLSEERSKTIYCPCSPNPPRPAPHCPCHC